MTRHLLICLTACLAACSSCETPTTPPGPEPLEMDEVIETLTELQVEHACRETWSCPARSYANTPFLTRHTSEQACNSDNGNLLEAFLLERYEQLRQGVIAGRVRYDGLAARTCIERARLDFEDTLCEIGLLQDPACDAIFDGLAAPGDGCVRDEECRGVMLCKSDQEDQPCTSTCRDCFGTECTTEQFCDKRAEACAPLAPTGADCFQKDQCGDQRQFGCNLGLGDGVSMGQCVVLGEAQVGDPCHESDQCDRGLVCNTEICVEAKVVERGEACSVTSPIVGLCPVNQACVAEEDFGMPSCAEVLQLGEKCTSLLQCAPNLQCERTNQFDPRTGTCKQLRPDGSPCQLPFECASGNCVPFMEGVSICLGGVTCAL